MPLKLVFGSRGTSAVWGYCRLECVIVCAFGLSDVCLDAAQVAVKAVVVSRVGAICAFCGESESGGFQVCGAGFGFSGA